MKSAHQAWLSTLARSPLDSILAGIEPTVAAEQFQWNKAIWSHKINLEEIYLRYFATIVAKWAIMPRFVHRWRKVILVTLTPREVPLTIRMSLSQKTERAPVWGNKHIRECQRNSIMFSDFVWRPRSLWFIGHWCYKDVHQQVLLMCAFTWPLMYGLSPYM